MPEYMVNQSGQCQQCRHCVASRKMAANEWVANIMLWGSGALLAIRPDMARDSWELFAVLFAGQMLWGISAYSMRKWSLLASSVFFCMLNIYGVLVRV